MKASGRRRRTIVRGTGWCMERFTQDVVSGYSSVHSTVCKLFGGLGAEKHRLHHCKK